MSHTQTATAKLIYRLAVGDDDIHDALPSFREFLPASARYYAQHLTRVQARLRRTQPMVREGEGEARDVDWGALPTSPTT